MEQDLMIYATLSFIVVIVILSGYLFYRRKQTTEHLYHNAMMQESNGHYEEAITLYQQYLKRSGSRMDPQTQQVKLRIKTLRILCL